MARNSQRKIHALRGHFSFISSLLSSATSDRFRRAKRDFSRGGPLAPDFLIGLLLFMVADAGRRGYRHLIDAFWDEAGSFDMPLPTERPISAPAFCEARKKITPALVRSLVHQAADAHDLRFGAEQRWLGRRAFAVDGCKVNLQRSDDLACAFGVPCGAHCPQAMVSTLFDLVSKVPHDVVVAPHGSSEREQLVLLLDRLKPGDVLVLDRGYPSFEVFCILLDAGIDFVVRVPATSSFAAVSGFVKAGACDRRVTLAPPRDSGLIDRAAINVRAVRTENLEGEPSVLLTSLRRNEFSRAQIVDLYRRRWEIEEFYKLSKSNYLGQGQFHARSKEGVEQEVLSVALFVGITRYLMAAAAEQHGIAYAEISPKAGVLGTADYVVRLLLLADPDRAPALLSRLLDRIIRTKDPKRPGRRFPRRSFKPVPKWCATGRRGG